MVIELDLNQLIITAQTDQSLKSAFCAYFGDETENVYVESICLEGKKVDEDFGQKIVVRFRAEI